MASNVIDTLRLSPHKVRRIMEELDRLNPTSGAMTKRRGMKRWTMQTQKSIVIIHENDAAPKYYATIPRDISSTGASFLLGAFLHPGVRCEFAARRVGGQSQALSGRVVRCRLVEGHVHEVAIHFDDPINPRDYFIDSGDAYMFNTEGIDPETMAGDVLLVCTNPGDEKLVRDAMRTTHVLLTHETDIEAAVERSLSPGFDFAFVYQNLADPNNPEADAPEGLEFIQRVRSEGLLMPMVLINDEHDRDMRMAAVAAGAIEMLAKPIAWDALYQAAGEFLSEFTTDHAERLDRDLQSLTEALSKGQVDGDANTLTEACAQLSRAVLRQEEESVINLLRVIELTASGIQCAEFAECAKETVDLLHRARSCQALHNRVRVLTRMSRTLASAA